MIHVKMTIAYDGTHFSGFQFQPKQRTIQRDLERYMSNVLKEPVKLLGSSRTDAGVHATGQVVKVSYNRPIPPENLKEVVNRVLPKDLGILKVEEVDEKFHPIIDTVSKTYTYRLLISRDPNPMISNYVWRFHRSLNIEHMRLASECLIGEHDFASFCASGSTVKSTVRTLYSIDIECEHNEIIIKFHGNGFLYNMVRIITGMLVQVGKGELPWEAAKDILEAKDRTKAPWTAPASGLCLTEIFYE